MSSGAAGFDCRVVQSGLVGPGAVCVSVGTDGVACGGPAAVCAENMCIDDVPGRVCPPATQVGAGLFAVEERFTFLACDDDGASSNGGGTWQRSWERYGESPGAGANPVGVTPRVRVGCVAAGVPARPL